MKPKKLSDLEVIKRCMELGIKGGWKNDIILQCEIDHMLFDQIWAKAVFGKRHICWKCGHFVDYNKSIKEYGYVKCYCQQADYFPYCWQYYLTQLVLAEDRIDYMRQWLIENKKI